MLTCYHYVDIIITTTTIVSYKLKCIKFESDKIMTTTTKTTTKKNATKNNKQKRTKKNNDVPMIIVNGVEMTIDKYRDILLVQLKQNRDNSKLCKRIRHLLRKKCQHFGGTRQRTYIDQTTNTKIHIDKQ